jgi:hypothetical protein
LSFYKGNSICNICRRRAKLTRDHVPPRCCGNDKDVVAHRIYADEMTAESIDVRARGGLRYKTLCESCNGNNLLGGWDDALGEFTAQVETIVDPALDLDQYVKFHVRTGAILRSVLGHIVAAKTQDDDVSLDQKIREYLLDGAPLDPDIRVYAWLYPYRRIVVARDFLFFNLVGDGGQVGGLASLLKFYPLAFCVLEREHPNIDTQFLTTFHTHADADPDAKADLVVWRSPIVDASWPQRPKGNHVVIAGKTFFDSVTTAEPGGDTGTPGKRIVAERWEGGDNAVLKGVHAFAEVQSGPLQPRRHYH